MACFPVGELNCKNDICLPASSMGQCQCASFRAGRSLSTDDSPPVTANCKQLPRGNICSQGSLRATAMPKGIFIRKILPRQLR